MEARMYRTMGALAVSALLAAAALTGCAKRGDIGQSVAQSIAQEEGPDEELKKGLVIDFDEAQDSAEELLDPEDYPFSSYIDTFVDEKTKTVNLIWPLKGEPTKEDGLEYAMAFIRAFNDACAEQDFSIPLSTETYYGGLYEKYAVNVQVFKEGDILNPENYLVSMTIQPGSKEKLVPFSEYDGVNEVWMPDGPTLIRGGKFSGDFNALLESYEASKEAAEDKEETAETAETKK